MNQKIKRYQFLKELKARSDQPTVMEMTSLGTHLVVCKVYDLNFQKDIF